MNINFGDTVKVITIQSMHEGKIGRVINIYEDEQTCLVRLNDGFTSGFFVRELEAIQPLGTEAVDIRLSADDEYTVALNLTPDEKRGVEKLVAAAKEIMGAGRHPYAPDIEIRKGNS